MNALRIALTSALLLGPAPALAQTGVRPDPADPRLSVRAPATESAFAGYRTFRDEPPVDWRAANDEMRALGGHAGHIREEAGPADRAAPASDQPAAKPPAAVTAGEHHAH